MSQGRERDDWQQSLPLSLIFEASFELTAHKTYLIIYSRENFALINTFAKGLRTFFDSLSLLGKCNNNQPPGSIHTINLALCEGPSKQIHPLSSHLYTSVQDSFQRHTSQNILTQRQHIWPTPDTRGSHVICPGRRRCRKVSRWR